MHFFDKLQIETRIDELRMHQSSQRWALDNLGELGDGLHKLHRDIDRFAAAKGITEQQAEELKLKYPL